MDYGAGGAANGSDRKETIGGSCPMIEAESDRILGFTAFGAEATELPAAVQTAKPGDLPSTIMRDPIYAHPTIGEGLVRLLAGVASIPKS